MNNRYEINRNKWKRLLKAAGLSQGQLAMRVGLSKNAMSNKVTGKCDFTVSELIWVADVLGTSPLNLINIAEPDGGSSDSAD